MLGQICKNDYWTLQRLNKNMNEREYHLILLDNPHMVVNKTIGQLRSSSTRTGKKRNSLPASAKLTVHKRVHTRPTGFYTVKMLQRIEKMEKYINSPDHKQFVTYLVDTCGISRKHLIEICDNVQISHSRTDTVEILAYRIKCAYNSSTSKETHETYTRHKLSIACMLLGVITGLFSIGASMKLIKSIYKDKKSQESVLQLGSILSFGGPVGLFILFLIVILSSYSSGLTSTESGTKTLALAGVGGIISTVLLVIHSNKLDGRRLGHSNKIIHAIIKVLNRKTSARR